MEGFFTWKKVVGLLAVCIVIVAAIFAFKFFTVPAPQPAAPVASGPAWSPEIPINEYWDYAKIGDLKIYVNNTDKALIYALDKTGKIAWKISGADYGFPGSGVIGGSSFEIWNNSGYLFVSKKNTDALDNNWTTLWVFDNQGRLKWTNNFYGYLDMPLMIVTTQKYVILQNRDWSVPKETGCGVMCDKNSAELTNQSAVWAFELETGKIVWKNTSRIGGRFVYEEKNQSLVIDGACEKADYAVNVETGIITNYGIGLFCVRSPDFSRWVFLPGEKEVQIQRYNYEKHKSAGEDLWVKIKKLDNSVYTYMSGLVSNDGYLISCHPTLSAVVCESQTGNEYGYHAFDLKTGKLLWSKKQQSKSYFIMDASSWGRQEEVNRIEVNGKIITYSYPKYECGDVCKASTCTTFVCEDKAEKMTPACKDCQKRYQEKKEYAAYDVRTGNLLWKFIPGSDVSLGFHVKDQIKSHDGELNVDYLEAKYYIYDANGDYKLIDTKKLNVDTGKEIK